MDSPIFRSSSARRFQKILEESPSPFLDDIDRLRMASAALTATIALKYEGTGTVEFLVDENKNFYFLELNARLQVKYPVTEMEITSPGHGVIKGIHAKEGNSIRAKKLGEKLVAYENAICNRLAWKQVEI